MSHADDDLDDLDDVLDQFNAPTPSTSSAPASASAAAPAPTSTGPSAPGPVDEFPDPDEDELDPLALPGDFASELEKGMAQLMNELSSGQGDEDESAELQQLMAGLMKGHLGGFGGSPGVGRDGAGQEGEMAALIAALSGGAASSGAFGAMPPNLGAVPPAASAGAKGKAREGASAAPPANFQDAIRASMEKKKQSEQQADSRREADKKAGEDPLAAMMAQMAGMGPGAGLGEEGIQGVLDEMMEQLMSRELLYGPLKELAEKYPDYLEKNKDTLSKEDLKRFTKQQGVVGEIVAKFEEPGADKEGDLTTEEETRRKARAAEVVELVAKMNECGAPPKEIMGEMPEGMELGPDGVPKLPNADDCSIM